MMQQNLNVTKGTLRWVRFVKHRIKNNKNFLGVFIGQTGSGKSYSALEFADLIMDGELPKENICFTASQFMKRLDDGLEQHTLPKGSVIIWDETGVDLNSKDWQSKTSKIISRVMQTFRSENIIVLFTVPYLDFITKDSRKLIHAYFQTEKILLKVKCTLVKGFNIQTNQVTGKMYRKHLKVKLGSQGTTKVKTLALPMPRKELVDYYEDTSNKFKRNIIKESRAEFDRIENDKKDKIKPFEYYKDMIYEQIKETPEALDMTMNEWSDLLGIHPRQLFRIGLNIIIMQLKKQKKLGKSDFDDKKA